MPSLLSKILYKMLKISKLNQKLKKEIDEDLLDAHPKAIPSTSMVKHCRIETKTNLNYKTYIWKSPNKTSDLGIFYIHGGAYVHGLSFMHFRLFKALIKKTNSTMVVPDYPLVPHASTEDIYTYLKQSYHENMHSFKHIIIMGDSAGGGLSLGLAQQLTKEGYDDHHVMLLSPWLDVSMENSLLDSIRHEDPILNKESLHRVGIMYARGRSLKDPMLSPLYGELKGITSLNIWTGTKDMLYADALSLQEKCQKAAYPLGMHIYQDMLHTWMFFGLKESRSMINHLAQCVNQIKQSF